MSKTLTESQQPLRDFDELILEYRKLRHDVNNSLAAMMAYAEMASTRPDYVQKLISLVLERSELTVEQMTEFYERMQSLKSKA